MSPLPRFLLLLLLKLLLSLLCTRVHGYHRTYLSSLSLFLSCSLRRARTRVVGGCGGGGVIRRRSVACAGRARELSPRVPAAGGGGCCCCLPREQVQSLIHIRIHNNSIYTYNSVYVYLLPSAASDCVFVCVCVIHFFGQTHVSLSFSL